MSDGSTPVYSPSASSCSFAAFKTVLIIGIIDYGVLFMKNIFLVGSKTN